MDKGRLNPAYSAVKPGEVPTVTFSRFALGVQVEIEQSRMGAKVETLAAAAIFGDKLDRFVVVIAS